MHYTGRQEGATDLRHILDGSTFMTRLGYTDVARMCPTHLYLLQDISVASGQWDGSSDELAFVETYLKGLEYDNYDRRLQPCGALALPSGGVLIEKRLVNAALRRGFNPLTAEKWRAFLELQRYFERALRRPIYSVLPSVVENTFGSTP